jgi:hypothetical protein
MPETYCHTLIPVQFDFVPQPNQVAAFLAELVSRRAAPLEAKYRLGKVDGFRTAVNPITQETVSIPRRRYRAIESVEGIVAGQQGLDDYNLQCTGKGPPNIPPMTLWVHELQPRTPGQTIQDVQVENCKIVEFKQVYGFIIHCCLRGEVVSTSDQHDSIIERLAPGFGEPYRSHNRLGIFNHPCTNKIIEVPNAGCARFWIEFEFGKWLFPKMDDRLDLLEPSIVETAGDCFGVSFIQGCHWYE